MSASGRTATRAIAHFAVGFDVDAVTPQHLRECGRAIADTYAVAIAGLREPASERALAYVLRSGTGGRSQLWGTGHRVGVEAAALFNGIAAHVLDYDDASSPMGGHPSVVLLPALLALGEERRCSGREVAAAYLVGFEIACRMGRSLAAEHYARGWHLTATLGTIACAVACARLLGLREDGVQHAIGLAVAQAGGTRASFGSDAKAFQAGQAGAAGLRAALLAETGFTAAIEAIDGPAGFTTLYSAGENLGSALHPLGAEPLELDTSGIEIKKYPACYAIHRPLDGLLDLRRDHGLRLDNVTAIEVQASHGALAPLLARPPASGSEGRFSMAYALAAALGDGHLGLDAFTDEAVARPELRQFLPRVTATEAPGTVLPRWAALRVSLADGRILSRRIDTLRGAPALPLTDEELVQKLDDCFRWGRVDADAGALLHCALRIGEVTVPSLMASLGAASLSRTATRSLDEHLA